LIAIWIAAAPTIFNANVLPVPPAELLKPVLKCALPSLGFLISLLKGHHYTDKGHLSRLLRARNERPRNRPAE
jgi:hypothetical protein